MKYLLLGQMQAVGSRGTMDLGSPRQRVLFASLLLQPNRVVTVDWLIEALWAGQPPRTARTKVQWYVSRLRTALALAETTAETARGTLVTHPAGYQMRVGPGELDTLRFEQLVAHGRGLAPRQPAVAASQLRAALALWRGEPLEGLPLVPWLEGEIAILREMRVTVLEDLFEAALMAGFSPGHIVADLKAAVLDYPLRERLRELLMSALYQSGRQAEALGVFQDTRQMLIRQLGIEPGAELRRLHRAMLAGEAITP